MQTFLPYPSFRASLACLDYRRLGKQRVEARQIYDCLTGVGSHRWISHPCVQMWKGYEVLLAKYHNSAIEEWKKRGYVNNMPFLPTKFNWLYYDYPSWYGNEKFHNSMKARLFLKDPAYYCQFQGVDITLATYWPGKE